MITLEEYSQIKNNYCLFCSGLSKEYPVILEIIRPIIEAKFPGLLLYICCRDCILPYLKGQRCFPISQIQQYKKEMIYFREFLYDATQAVHPIEPFLTECDMDSCIITPQIAVKTTKCTIISSGDFPTVPLTSSQINCLKQIAICRGFEPVVDDDWNNAGWVVGVESVGLFRAAEAGIETTLIPTGVGTSLVKKMFPEIEILDVN